MTAFKNHVNEVIKNEISTMIDKQGYALETALCNGICEKYGFRISTVRGTLRGIYPEMFLIKRRLSGELKTFYGIETKGCPIMYLPDMPTGNC